jgi:hypothetical protein
MSRPRSKSKTLPTRVTCLTATSATVIATSLLEPTLLPLGTTDPLFVFVLSPTPKLSLPESRCEVWTTLLLAEIPWPSVDPPSSVTY